MALRVAVNSELARDLGGRGLLVARDHDGADAGRAADADGHRRLVAERIDHADQAHEDQVSKRVVRVVALREVPVGQAEHAKCAAGQFPVQRLPTLPAFLGQWHDSAGPEFGSARNKQRPRRPLDVADFRARGRLVHRDHAPRLTGEGNLALARILMLQDLACQTGLLSHDDQRTFSRIAEDGGGAAGAIDPRVVAQRADAQRKAKRIVGRDIDALALNAEFSRRRVPCPGDLDPTGAELHGTHRHLVPCERPGLVRADDRR